MVMRHAQVYTSPFFEQREDGRNLEATTNEETQQKGHGEKSNRRTAAKQCTAGSRVTQALRCLLENWVQQLLKLCRI